mgnify:FL=1
MMVSKGIFKGVDDDEDEVTKFLARNNYLLSSRGFLETAFFFNPKSIGTFLSRPVPVMDLYDSFGRVFTNFRKELEQTVSGVHNSRDKTPYMYYTLKDFFPMGRFLNQMFDPQENIRAN